MEEFESRGEGQSDEVSEGLNWMLLALKTEEGNYKPENRGLQKLKKASKWIVLYSLHNKCSPVDTLILPNETPF